MASGSKASGLPNLHVLLSACPPSCYTADLIYFSRQTGCNLQGQMQSAGAVLRAESACQKLAHDHERYTVVGARTSDFLGVIRSTGSASKSIRPRYREQNQVRCLREEHPCFGDVYAND